jgi:ABC-type sugar transport system ATPase subunit
MNIVSATVTSGVDGAGSVQLRIGTGAFELSAEIAIAVAASGLDEVAVGIRPEHLRLGEGPIAAEVRAVESLGHERHLVCELAGTDPNPESVEPGALVIIRQSAEDPAPQMSQTVRLVAEARHLHLFDPTSGARLI